MQQTISKIFNITKNTKFCTKNEKCTYKKRQQDERANTDVEVPEREVKTTKRKYAHITKSIEFSSPWAKWLDRGDHQVCDPTTSWSHYRTSNQVLNYNICSARTDNKGMPPH